MVSKEIIELKELFYKELREMDKTFKNDLEKISSFFDEKYKEYEDSINLSIIKNEQLYEQLIKEKNNLEKIDQLSVSCKKLNDMIMTHELKIKELNLSNQRLTTNYDKLIIDNLTVPGYVGNSCVYPTLSEYILTNINEVEKIKIEQETQKKVINNLKYKIENLMKNILNILDNTITRCNTYTDKKQKYLQEFIENKFVEINEKNVDLRAQVFTNINVISKNVENFEDQVKELKDLKYTIKNEIDNILKDFQKKIENDEKNRNKKFEDNIKNEINKILSEEKNNKTQIQGQSPRNKNKYIKRENTISTSYNKQVTERQRNSLFISYNTKTFQNFDEKIKKDKFDKYNQLVKKRTQVFTMNNDFKHLQMINKIDEDDKLSESIQSQKISIHNKSKENNIVNENGKKGEGNKKFEKIEKSNKIQINKSINMNNKEKFIEKKEDEENNFILGEKKKNNNKFKDGDLSIEKIVEKENESKSKEMEENESETKKEEENKEKNEEIKMEEKKDHNREEEKNESIYTKEKIEENIENQFKNNFKVKEDDKSNLKIELKNKDNINKENNEINICLTEIRDNNPIQVDITNEIKNINIPKLINENKENKQKFEIIKNKQKRSRNESLLNNNFHFNQNNFHSFNNLKKKIKIRNLKTENEQINTSSKSNSNSQRCINSYKEKELEPEIELKAINSERLIFNRTTPKFFIKDKKYENIQIQAEKKNKYLSFPRLYCNFKLINLGSNIHFVRNESLLEQSKDKTKENKKINIDFTSPITNTYKAYQKKKKEKKISYIINNIYQNKIAQNEPKKLELELKGEAVKMLNYKNNYSIAGINFNNNKKNIHNAENQTEIK